MKNKITSIANPKFSSRFVSLNETLDGVNKSLKSLPSY